VSDLPLLDAARQRLAVGGVTTQASAIRLRSQRTRVQSEVVDNLGISAVRETAVPIGIDPLPTVDPTEYGALDRPGFLRRGAREVDEMDLVTREELEHVPSPGHRGATC